MNARQISFFGLVMLAPLAFGRTIRVPEEFLTIQLALNSVQDGDTVLVALGTYAEALIAPPRLFVLKGDVIPDTGDYVRPLIDISTLPGSDSLTSLILPEHSSVILEDMAFRNGPEMYPNFTDGGIHSNADNLTLRRVNMDSVIVAVSHFSFDSSSVVTLEHCHFRHIMFNGVEAYSNSVHASHCLFSQNQGIMISCGDNSVITDCRFEADQSPADYMIMSQGQHSEILRCEFTATQTILSSAVLVRFWGAWADNPVVISENLFTGLHGFHPPLLVHYDFPGYSSVIVSDNIFAENEISAPGRSGAIEFEEELPFQSQILAVISNNVFAHCSGLSMPAANALWLCAGAELIGNRLFGLSPHTVPAVRNALDSEYDNPVALRGNLFYGNGLALDNDDEVLVDAGLNWWGDETGPFHAELNPGGQGDTIVGNVDFDPWYADTSFLATDVPRHGVPARWELSAHPNPFNSSIRIALAGFAGSDFEITLHNLLGQEVDVIHRGPLTGGQITYQAPPQLASGVYFLRASDHIAVQSRKVVLIK